MFFSTYFSGLSIKEQFRTVKTSWFGVLQFTRNGEDMLPSMYSNTSYSLVLILNNSKYLYLDLDTLLEKASKRYRFIHFYDSTESTFYLNCTIIHFV